LIETLKAESLARLRHDLRTPVNHILGYTELLIDDAAERHLEAQIPALQGIQNGGRELLEIMRTGLGESTGPEQEVDLDSFRHDLQAAAAGVLKTCSSLQETAMQNNTADADPQTVADLDAICRALRRLVDFSLNGMLPPAT
jgi:signal transduction histidine kinase